MYRDNGWSVQHEYVLVYNDAEVQTYLNKMLNTPYTATFTAQRDREVLKHTH